MPAPVSLAPLVVLGPQRPAPNLVEALDALDVKGPLVLITAGWRHDEAETEALRAHVQRPTVALPLYSWFEDLEGRLPDLAREHKARSERIREYVDLHRVRLRAALVAIRELLARRGDSPDLVEVELKEAFAQLAEMDAHLLRRVERIREEFPALSRPWEIPEVAERHHEAARLINESGAVLVAGGHIAVLRNRMAFFGLDEILPGFLGRGGHVVAWSAGAMALSRRVVLFYDDPPEGVSEAEILDSGMGLIPGLVAFPHARRRLRLDQSDRVAAIARRFTPDACLGMENGAWVDNVEGRWVNRGRPGTAFRLAEDGSVAALEELPSAVSGGFGS